MADDDRIDFSSFEAVPLEQLARGIATRGAPLLAARRRQQTSRQIAAWWRPTLAAALAVIALSSFVLARPRRIRVVGATEVTASLTTAQVSPAVEVAQALGVPAQLAAHLRTSTPPTLVDLVQGVVR